MSTERETLECIRHAVRIAEIRLKALDAKPRLTRAESFERDMTVATIRKGKRLLAERTPGAAVRDAISSAMRGQS